MSPSAYSDLIKSDLLDSSRVSPFSSPCSKSPLLPAMETSPKGPLVANPNSGRTSCPCQDVGEEEEERKAQGSGSS